MKDEAGNCNLCDNGLRECSCCRECGEGYSMEHTTRDNDGKCFSCSFWHQRWCRHKANPDTSFIVKGTAYMVCAEPEEGKRPIFQGFGGSKFDIYPHSGGHIVSHNVWCQGDVPDRFKDRLPNNAAFIKPD